jgi:N-methylhydantoinase A
MGGTSCDVCVIDDGRVPETAERTVAGRPLALPALDIHTVGAGGGSIAWRDAGGALRVGPASAGARPGPACYGRGGREATVTDANLLLGRLPEDAPLAGGLMLDRLAAERAIGSLARELELTQLECAEGIVRVAEGEMLGALRLMTVERGIDPRGFALMPFGGAGPLHAAALARELGIARILCPRASGVLSALGLAAAAPRRDIARTLALRGDSFSPHRLAAERSSMLVTAASELGETPTRARVSHELRYRGQAFELTVEEEIEPGEESSGMSPGELRESFAEAHERRYGYREEAAEIELVTMRVSVWGSAPALRPLASGDVPPSAETRPMIFAGESRPASVFRGLPAPGSKLRGPSLCALPDATLLIPPGWSARVDDFGTIHMHDGQAG